MKMVGKVCRGPECVKIVEAKELCSAHYRQMLKGKPLKKLARREKIQCSFAGCVKLADTRGLCIGHHCQSRRGQELKELNVRSPRYGLDSKCKFEGCESRPVSKLLCSGHASQRDRGVELRTLRKHAGWNDGLGYRKIRLPSHPNANKLGILSEHTYVMSEMIGRSLLPGENVHHKNGQRSDNRPENLELWVRKQPGGQRVEDLIEWAVELLTLYQPELLK